MIINKWQLIKYIIYVVIIITTTIVMFIHSKQEERGFVGLALITLSSACYELGKFKVSNLIKDE